MDPLQLIENNASRLRDLGARRVGIFGSFARGEETPESDIDVYVELDDQKRTFRNFNAIYELLESLFHRPVDLVTDGALNERKAKIILPTVKYASLGN